MKTDPHALARAAGLPLATLLGAVPRPLPAYFSQGMDGKARGIELAHECRERGFKAMKIKVGYPTLDEDLDVIHAVQAALGGEAELMVDYNQSLSVPDAVRRCQALDTLELAWIGEPVRHDDHAGHAEVARATRTPIQTGENWFGLAEMAKCVDARGSDLVMPDLMKIGGVSGWIDAAALAAARGLPMSNDIFHEASAHALCATTTAHWLEYLPLADPVLAQPLEVRDGHAMVPSRPGSGVEWDAGAVKRWRLA